MLDWCHPEKFRRREDSLSGWRPGRSSVFRVCFMKRNVFASLTILCLLCFADGWAHCQDILDGNGQSAQSQSPDCADPLLAGSAVCRTAPTPAQPSAVSGVAPPSTHLRPQAPRNSNYTDLGPYSQYTAPPVKLPPQPLTEFQKFVASTTGRVLPIFEADLFDHVPSTFSPLSMAPVPSNYVIGPGDEVRIRTWGELNLSSDVRVDRSGEIYLPEVGQVHVAGLPYSELQKHLQDAIGRVYRNFQVSADLGQIRAIQVYVTGQARRPGVYTVSSLSTLVDAIFASGGPSSSGSMRDIQLIRGGHAITTFDLYDLLIKGDKTKDASLHSGDVIFIPPVGPQVALIGSVHTPAIYELIPGESLSEAITDAGGPSAVASQTRISIERTESHRDRYAMDVTWDSAGLATPLHDGDLVRLYSILPLYQKTVTLRGNIANPGRFAWHPGMRISDLIPDKASLVTRRYWWKRAQLGLPAPEFEPLLNTLKTVQPETPRQLPSGEFVESAPEISSDQSGLSGQVEQSGFSGEVEQGSKNSRTLPAMRQSAARHAGNGSLAAGFGPERGMIGVPRNTVGSIAPDIDWDYAVIERLNPRTLKEELLPFDLGRLILDHDQSQDILLKSGDVVTIFSQNDIRVPQAQETKFVHLEGEFVHAGVYTAHSGETLRDLVQRAGGFTPQAYLYGSQFTRESTRVLQQQRIDEYAQELQMEMQRSSVALAASALSPQTLASGASAQSSEQALIHRLEQVRATGRIVLQFTPGSHGLDVLPNVTLENGDRFVVPPVPASVNVVGAVYDQNSFLFRQGLRAGEYIRLAGGPNRDADRKHMFIIRADGSVVSRAGASTLWGNDFNVLRINPGDTIVIPEKVYKPSALVGIMDWSQLFSQFALGAAALSVIR